jgi:hypothetical protein
MTAAFWSLLRTGRAVARAGGSTVASWCSNSSASAMPMRARVAKASSMSMARSRAPASAQVREP